MSSVEHVAKRTLAGPRRAVIVVFLRKFGHHLADVVRLSNADIAPHGHEVDRSAVTRRQPRTGGAYRAETKPVVGHQPTSVTSQLEDPPPLNFVFWQIAVRNIRPEIGTSRSGADK